MNREATFVIDGGTVTGLAGGPLSLGELGPRTTRRASYLEFNSATQLWEVLSPDTREVLFSHADYGNALQWETDHFNAQLAQS